MRITNKMMNNNSLSNINSNKTYLDKLNNQLASGKKITRPSDDPIVAIRALKLRSNVTELTQYYDKNTNDAQAWLEATQSSLQSTVDILTSMKAQFTKGATGTNTTDSRSAILKELQSLRDQIYDNGNDDYAGRQLFTGYRTSTPLTVSSDALPLDYSDITETFTAEDMDSVTYVSGGLTTAEVNAADGSQTEQSVSSTSIDRIRLAYDKINAADGDTMSFDIKDSDGNVINTITATVVNSDNADYPDAAYDVSGGSIFNAETGELLLSSSDADTIKNLDNGETLEVKYDKNQWEEGDLRPEHYFSCKSTDAATGKVTEYTDHDLAIMYDVSSGQQMQINTNASEVYFHGIGRDVDEMIAAIEDVDAAAEKVAKLEAKLEDTSLSDAEKANVQTTLDAANKEFDLLSDKMQKMFESGQTSFTSYITKASLATTNCGSRLERVELVQNRLLDLKTTATELADSNENAEITDVAINISEAELCYNAALMATGQISQQTLLSYI